MEHDQKLIRPGEAQNEFVHPVAHQIWAKSDQRFVCKTTQPIRGQETAETQWMEHVQKLIRPGEARNEWVHQIWSKSDPQKLLDESEARIPRKQQKFSRAWPKVHQAWGVP